MEGWHRTPAHPRSRPPQGLAQALMPHWSFSDPQDTGGRGASPTDGVGGGDGQHLLSQDLSHVEGQAGPQSGWDWGSSGSSGATGPWGEALILPAPRPAPPHAAACAELSSRLQGLLRHAAPPGPAPHSPPRARNLFSRECQGVLRGLYFPGARGAPESSQFCSWEGGQDPSLPPSLSQSHTEPTLAPYRQPLPFLVTEGGGLGKLKTRVKPTGDACLLGSCGVPAPTSTLVSGRTFFFSPQGESHLPSKKATPLPMGSVCPSQPGNPS